MTERDGPGGAGDAYAPGNLGKPGGGGSAPEKGRPTGRIVLAAGVLPSLVVLAGAALVVSWRGELPDPVAVHWGGDGSADGFAPFGVLLTVVLSGLVWVAFCQAVALAVRVPELSRFVAALGAGTGSFIAGLSVLGVAQQRGLADATQSTLGGWVIPLALALGLIVGLVALWAIPHWRAADPRSGDDAGRSKGRYIELSPDERVLWTRRMVSNEAVIVLLAIIIPANAVLVALSRRWFLVGVMVALFAVLAVCYSVRVTVDDAGFTVRGALRWPRVHIPLDRIASARVVTVHALRDSGGFGYRVFVRGEVAGAKGFVLRSGDAVLVDRTDGGREVVVVDDAETAAGLLNALVHRSGSPTAGR